MRIFMSEIFMSAIQVENSLSDPAATTSCTQINKGDDLNIVRTEIEMSAADVYGVHATCKLISILFNGIV